MAPAEPSLAVEVVYCARPGHDERIALRLPAAATVGDALRESGLALRHGLTGDALRVGVWGRNCTLETPLRERDRVELYRPLTVDPKEARRLRYKKHRQAPAP